MDLTAPRRSPFRRFAFDREGHLRGWRLLGMSAAVALILTIGGLAAAVIAGAGSPGALALWATVAFVGIKIPVLGLLWWLLGRSEHEGDDAMLADSAAHGAISRLRAAADRATGTPDEWDRLDALAAEAGYVAAHCAPSIAGDAAGLRSQLIESRDRLRSATPR